jgi:thiamine biosynthesis lipoprotein
MMKSDLRMLRAEIEDALDQVDVLMSTWRPESEISEFNAFSSTVPFPVSTELAHVVRRALTISFDTDGAFDPTVKPLVDHWGFGPGENPSNIQEILKSVGWRKVRLKEGGLVKTAPELQLDLSAIAKGYGVDCVATVIRDSGQEDFLVEIGGEVVAEGVSPRGEAWRIGVETPEEGQPFGGEVYSVVTISDKALATSGDYRNFRVREDGSRYSHLIDPITGQPAETDIASVSVLADRCMDADAVATALFVMGSERALSWLKVHPGFEAYLILHGPDGSFTAVQTTNFPLKDLKH